MKTFQEYMEDSGAGDAGLQATGRYGNVADPSSVKTATNKAFTKIGEIDLNVQRRRTLLSHAISSLAYTDVQSLLRDIRAVAKELQVPGAENEPGAGKPPLGVVTAPNITQAPYSTPVQ